MDDRDGRRLRPEPMMALELATGVHAWDRASMHARHGDQARHHLTCGGSMGTDMISRRLQGPKPHEREPRREQHAGGMSESRHGPFGR